MRREDPPHPPASPHNFTLDGAGLLDDQLADFINSDATLQKSSKVREKSFGTLFHFNRLQRKRNGEFVSCQEIDEANGFAAGRTSCIERSVTLPTVEQALDMLRSLEKSATANGLKDFLCETEELINAYEIRRDNFAHAINYHHRPDGGKPKNGSREALATAMHVSNTYVTEMFNGQRVPDETQVAAALKFYNIRNEAEFYAEARKHGSHESLMPLHHLRKT